MAAAHDQLIGHLQYQAMLVPGTLECCQAPVNVAPLVTHFRNGRQETEQQHALNEGGQEARVEAAASIEVLATSAAELAPSTHQTRSWASASSFTKAKT